MTNFERIKSMGIDEMADFLGFFNAEEDMCSFSNRKMGVEYCGHHSCRECALKYLESQQ